MLLSIEIRNKVLTDLAFLLKENKAALIKVNTEEVALYAGNDITIGNRLIINKYKFDGMINSLITVANLPDPLNELIYEFETPEKLKIQNRTAAFGTIFIIYESRPDVTIEAAAIAFKSGNKLILKGGKESHISNKYLIALWHLALLKNNVDTSCIKYLELDRTQTQNYLQTKQHSIDLVIPRGGDSLINFVKQYSNIPVLVSGRGNNFIFIDESVNFEIVLPIILNNKLTNISACNSVDKLIFHEKFIKNNKLFYDKIITELKNNDVEINYWEQSNNDDIMFEEFLSKKILIINTNDKLAAINLINKYSGKHSASILSDNEEHIQYFFDMVDCAAVYSNASTRFTDGGQFGLGAEMAISTDKLHHRGPLGLQHLVTNKWIIIGNGQIRK